VTAVLMMSLSCNCAQAYRKRFCKLSLQKENRRDKKRSGSLIYFCRIYGMIRFV
jgi:hypothetical protein